MKEIFINEDTGIIWTLKQELGSEELEIEWEGGVKYRTESDIENPNCPFHRLESDELDFEKHRKQVEKVEIWENKLRGVLTLETVEKNRVNPEETRNHVYNLNVGRFTGKVTNLKKKSSKHKDTYSLKRTIDIVPNQVWTVLKNRGYTVPVLNYLVMAEMESESENVSTNVRCQTPELGRSVVQTVKQEDLYTYQGVRLMVSWTSASSSNPRDTIEEQKVIY